MALVVVLAVGLGFARVVAVLAGRFAGVVDVAVEVSLAGVLAFVAVGLATGPFDVDPVGERLAVVVLADACAPPRPPRAGLGCCGAALVLVARATGGWDFATGRALLVEKARTLALRSSASAPC